MTVITRRIGNSESLHDILNESFQYLGARFKGEVLIKAGSKEIANIGKNTAFQLKIDDQIYSFKTEDIVTRHDDVNYGHGVVGNHSNKSFWVSENIIRKASQATTLLARIHFLDNTFADAKCSELSFEEYKEQTQHLGLSVSRRDLERANRYAPIHGIKAFVQMMDTTSW